MTILTLSHLLFIGSISWWWFHKFQGPAKPYFWYGLVAKVMGGIAFGLLYKFYFQGGDTWSFFENSKILASFLVNDHMGYVEAVFMGSIPDHIAHEIGYVGQPRALLMVRVLSLLTLVTGANYWLCSIYLSLFAFYGTWTLVDQISKHYRGSVKAAVVAFLLYPSALFWGSGISKEAIYVGGFGLLVAWLWPYFKKLNESQYKNWLFSLALVYLLVQLKYYYMAVLLPTLIATVIHHKLQKPDRNWILNHGIWVMIFTFLMIAASWLHQNLGALTIGEAVKQNARDIAFITGPDHTIKYFENSNPTVWMVVNFPWAVLTGLFRPFIGDWGSIWQNLAVFENLLISMLLISRLFSINKKAVHRLDWLPGLVYIILLAALLSLSTPNFGTLVRYKVSFMPLFLFFILYKNPWWEKIMTQPE